jgi:DNA-binding protein H-NS
MNNLIDIQTQIAILQKQADEIKTKDFQGTVQEILTKMQAFGITVKDLQTVKLGKTGKLGRGKAKAAGDKAPKLVKPAKKSTTPVAAKYRGPNGETWSGRGLTPRWMSTLIAQGQSKESFTINA